MPDKPPGDDAPVSDSVAEARPKHVSLIPSRVWWLGGRGLWSGLNLRERAMIVLGLVLPAIDQLTRLGSVGITMRAVGKGVREPLELEARIWLCLLILAAFTVAAVVQMLSSKVKRDIKAQLTRMVRRTYGRIMAGAGALPKRRRAVEVEAARKAESQFVKSAAGVLSDLLDLFSAILIVLFLLGLLIWFNPLVGLILFAGGVAALIVLRFRVHEQSRADGEKTNEAKEKLRRCLQEIAEVPERSGALVEKYANNQYDRITFAALKKKNRRTEKISTAMNLGAAFIMALVFYIVSAEGAFDEAKITWIVVFVFGLRIAVTYGRSAMVKWGAVLGEQSTLLTMAKASMPAPHFPWSDKEEGDYPIDDQEVDELAGEFGVKILSCEVKGLNHRRIIYREPLVVEMCVESRTEVEEVSWSFAISNWEGTIFLIAKSSADHGITWDLPKGRSRFRLVSGPVLLPPGTYSAWIGIAKGSRTLDLVGSKTDPVALYVLPYAAEKRPTSMREVRNVVAMDVEWERELQSEAAAC